MFSPLIKRAPAAATMAFLAAMLAAPVAGMAPAAAQAAGAATSTGTGRLVVTFRQGTTAATKSAVGNRYGLTQRSDNADLGSEVVTVPAGAEATTLAALRHDPSVASADTDHVAVPATVVTPNDPYFSGGINGPEWGEIVDNVQSAWGTSTGSPTVTIAVVDSGVDPTHPDLTANLVPGWNVLTGTSDTTDSVGHGTEVAGVVAAGTNNSQGVAAYCWACRLMPVEVYNTASGGYQSDLALGITWAVDHGANVINVSMVGADEADLDNAVAYALAHNVVVVAAAGNVGTTAKQYPAAIPGVISVAASTSVDALQPYSTYGSWVDIAAPGSQESTLFNGGYGNAGGTSIASPAVAGIVGLMLSAHPGATPSQVASALFSTTSPVNGANQVAYGRVDAAGALAALGSPAPVTAPTNTAPPVISGSAQSGQTLSTSTGSWSGSSASYSYQWQRCSSAGCTPVSGATSATYALTSADVGSTIEVTVTASNSAGSATATSSPTAAVVAGMRTSTFSGSLNKNSAAFVVAVGSGSMSSSLSFSKCSSLTMKVTTSSGAMVAQGSGPSVLTMSGSVTSGSDTWTVSGSCRSSFTLTVVTPAP